MNLFLSALCTFQYKSSERRVRQEKSWLFLRILVTKFVSLILRSVALSRLSTLTTMAKVYLNSLFRNHFLVWHDKVLHYEAYIAVYWIKRYQENIISLKRWKEIFSISLTVGPRLKDAKTTHLLWCMQKWRYSSERQFVVRLLYNRRKRIFSDFQFETGFWNSDPESNLIYSDC